MEIFKIKMQNFFYKNSFENVCSIVSIIPCWQWVKKKQNFWIESRKT